MNKYKYVPLIILLLPIVFLLLPWYSNVLPTNKFTHEDANGIYVMLEDGGRIIIVYLFCFIIQHIAIQKHAYVYSIIALLIFLIELTFFPVIFFPISIWGAHFLTNFSIGYYLTNLLLIINLLINTKRLISYRKNK